MTALIRVIGTALLLTGIAVFGFGLNSSQVFVEKGLEKTTGRYSENTMWYILGGIALIAGGGALAFNARAISKDR